MRRYALIPLLLLVAGCDRGNERPETNDIDAAVHLTGGDAVDAAGNPRPLATASSAAMVADDGSRAAATAVVKRYYDLIAGRRGAEAQALWAADLPAKGVTPESFARSFAAYAGYQVAIGRAGDVDEGAWQRYVSVPVVLTGRLKNGRPFTTREMVTLHRVAPQIDTVSDADHRWRIIGVDIDTPPVTARSAGVP